MSIVKTQSSSVEFPNSHNLSENKTIPKSHWGFIFGSLGVVYGDIGTSPLYALRECFSSQHNIPFSPDNILGILSLIFWSLTLVVSVKYITFVMRADNAGQGGIMALMALLTKKLQGKKTVIISSIAIFGTALIFADGIITPAISVLSALEGFEIVTPALKPFIIPMALFILILLFWFQKKGTATVAGVFGPVMFVWFFVLAVMGIYWIAKAPQVFYALNPFNAVNFFIRNSWPSFFVLGGVVLCVTGTEALYADMGHFGRKPITQAWYYIVYPALLLNYFGQGAFILVNGPNALANPFYGMVSSMLLIPMVILSTIATIIASQALISGSYSLAQQAIQLGYSPRLNITHTSHQTHGQIYIAEVNFFLMFACCALVLLFKNSSSLAAAYGIAVTGTMTMTSFLFFNVLRSIWGWNLLWSVVVVGIFLIMDLSFLTSNLGKIVSGGWVPIVIGITLYYLMMTWRKGKIIIGKRFEKDLLPLPLFFADIITSNVPRVKGTAIFMTSLTNVAPPVLLHHYKHNKVLHERVIFLGIKSEMIPEVPALERIQITDLHNGFWQITARYGFMETPSMYEIIERVKQKGMEFHLHQTSFYLGRESLVVTNKSGMSILRKRIFKFMSRNAPDATAYYGIPPNRVIELGAQFEI